MSRSQQQDLAPDPKPGTVKVNGAGLMHWGGRAKAGEVHIYRMICDGTWNGIYTLSLIWLEGRTMYRHGEKPADNLTRAGIAEEASQDLQGRALAAGGSTPPPATNPMKPTPRTPCTDDEKTAVEALARVSYPVASWDKRFSRQLSPAGLTEKERPQVWRLFVKYRRQINCPRKAELLKVAETLAAPDFRKQQVAANEQARINAMRQQQQTNP